MSTSPTPPSNQPPTWPVPPPTQHIPPGPKPKRRGRILLAAALGLALLVATGFVAIGSTTDAGPGPNPPTSPTPGPTDPPTPDPTPPSDPPKEDPEPEPAPVEIPILTGMTRAEAEQALADLGLKVTTRYKSTDQYPAGTVISQSPEAGAEVPPDTTITVVVAKTPPAPAPPLPSTAPPPPSTPAPTCDPSYPDVCLDPAVEDYDCAGGSGNGPEYVAGPIRVRPPDPFGLDRDGDGWGCENRPAPTRPITGSPNPANPADPPVDPAPRSAPPKEEDPEPDPAAVVRDYFAAINAHDYRKAWRLGGKNFSRSYEDFVRGFAGTEHDTLTVLNVDGPIVTIRMVADESGGRQSIYQGTYTAEHGELVAANVRRVPEPPTAQPPGRGGCDPSSADVLA